MDKKIPFRDIEGDGKFERNGYRRIWVEVNGPIPKGYQLHHINLNHKDDRLENLELLTPKEHRHRHYLYFNNPLSLADVMLVVIARRIFPFSYQEASQLLIDVTKDKRFSVTNIIRIYQTYEAMKHIIEYVPREYFGPTLLGGNHVSRITP